MADVRSMIPGIDKFEERFAGDAGAFVLIGGAARELIFAEAGLWDDTATKDLDIVLIAEALDAAFVSRFLGFVGDAGYSHVTKSGDRQMFRFSNPADPAYPYQVELLSRKPDYLQGVEAVVGKVPVDDSEYSLSAILLDDDHYGLLSSGIAVTRKYGMPTLKHEYLPVFKMRAFDDLSARKARGEDVRSGEINKHRRDIFRLVSMLPGGTHVELSDSVKEEVLMFLDAVTLPSPNYMKAIGLGNASFEDMKEAIRSVYLG